MADAVTEVNYWLREARQKLAAGQLNEADLDALVAAADGTKPRVKQRLLYLHATTPHIGSRLTAATLHEPKDHGTSTMDPMQQDPDYNSVHEAIRDGWQVIHFPNQLAPFDDKEIDILGYEFVLQKMEAIND